METLLLDMQSSLTEDDPAKAWILQMCLWTEPPAQRAYLSYHSQALAGAGRVNLRLQAWQGAAQGANAGRNRLQQPTHVLPVPR